MNHESPPISSIAVVGAGAVGGFFGAMLARAGHRVTLIVRAPHVEAIEREGLRLQMQGRTEAIRTVVASDDMAAVAGADLVLVSVKSTDTEDAARRMAPHLAPNALVLSLQNGVENAPALARAVSRTVIPAVVYVATSMPQPGQVVHHGRGELVIGALHARDSADAGVQQRLQQVVELFASASVPVTISPDVMAAQWTKLMVNCAYNAVSGLAQANYSQMAAQPPIRELQQELVREVVAVAAADGVSLSLDECLRVVLGLPEAMPAQLSSTAQDMARRKPTEIEHLNGFIVRRGRELGIAVPTNQAMYALVRLAEACYAQPAADQATPGY